MGSQAGLLLFVLCAGFVAAGLLNALHRTLIHVDEEEEASPMVLRFDSSGSIAWSMFVCVFAGPYLVLSNGLYFWRMSVLPTPALLTCGLLSVIWSFCSGVFIVESWLALSSLAG